MPFPDASISSFQYLKCGIRTFHLLHLMHAMSLIPLTSSKILYIFSCLLALLLLLTHCLIFLLKFVWCALSVLSVFLSSSIRAFYFSSAYPFLVFGSLLSLLESFCFVHSFCGVSASRSSSLVPIPDFIASWFFCCGFFSAFAAAASSMSCWTVVSSFVPTRDYSAFWSFCCGSFVLLLLRLPFFLLLLRYPEFV